MSTHPGPPAAARPGDTAGTLRLLAYLGLAILLLVLDHRGGWMRQARAQAQLLVQPVWALAGLPGRYGAPGGGLWLAWVNGLPAGCVGLRPLEDDVCEMKRLYVRPDHAGHGLGRGLAEAALAGARERGYRVMRLDTLKSMTAANALYRKLGFEQIGPYCDNPFEEARYYELTL